MIFHARGSNSLCTWLILNNGELISVKKNLLRSDLDVLQPKLWQKLGVRGVRGARSPRLAKPIEDKDFDAKEPSFDEWDSILKPISKLLFPKQIVKALFNFKIDTLMVVPISIRAFDPSHDLPETLPTDTTREFKLNDLPKTNSFVLAVSTIPFAALPIKDKRLVHLVSVVIAPGFFSFAQNPLSARRGFSDPIILGDPEHREFNALPGARQEAKDVAQVLKVQALLGDKATKKRVDSMLRQHAETIDLVHLATRSRR